MARVPAGAFTMGADPAEGYLRCVAIRGDACKPSWFEDEDPIHKVYLDEFYIDIYEVTNAQFLQFAEATGYVTDAERVGYGTVWDEGWKEVPGVNWRHPTSPRSGIATLMDHPVAQVTWNDANAYCAWAGKRLPTEAEWAKAARGTDGRIYPWGNEWEGERLNHGQGVPPRWDESDGYRYTAPVGTFPAGESPYGVHNMGGNVWEWVADWHDPEYYARSPYENPKGPPSGEKGLCRGGSWWSYSASARTATRHAIPRGAAMSAGGFRCAASP